MSWSGSRYRKAPLGARLGASLLDGLIGTAAWLPGIVLIAMGGAGEGEGIAIVGTLVLVIGFVWALYYSFVKDGWGTGASFGKRAVGLMVVHLPTNQPCTKGQSALRALVLLLLNFVPFIGWLIEPILVLAADDGRRLGDRAADTQVVTVADYAAVG
ncbi:MAG TPA: RDD family protein [Gemmatimonadaceae bacterium]|nr:RDD family protein [Gemmatimonadaceae bacterium]